MKISELLKPDPFKAQTDAIKKQEQALKQRRANIKSQKAQKNLRDVRAAADNVSRKLI